MANLFQFVAAITVLVIVVPASGWSSMTALFAMLCTSSAVAWGWHYDEFCRHTGLDLLPGMPSPVILAAAAAGFGYFAVQAFLHPLLWWAGRVPAVDSFQFNIGGLGFCVAWAWWWTQELYDFFDAHAVAA